MAGARMVDRAGVAEVAVAGVLFDLGGTLFSYASRRQMGQATTAALQRLGFDPAAPDVRAARRAASEAVQREYASKRSFLHTDLFRDRLARTVALLGTEAPADLLDRFEVENVAAILQHMPAREGSIELLEELGARGIYRAVVSNADDAWLEPAIKRADMDACLDDWTSSEEAQSCKPDPLIFRYALEKAGLEPAEVLFVGDSPHHDVTGAHNVGIRTVLISGDAGQTPLSVGLEAMVEPEYRIDELIDLLEIVDGLNRL